MLSLHFIDGAGVTCTAEELPPPPTLQSSLAQLTASPPIPSGVVLATELSAVHNCCRSGRGSLLFCQLARRDRAVSQDGRTCACIAQHLAHSTPLRKSGSHSSTRCAERCQARLRYFRLPFLGQPASACLLRSSRKWCSFCFIRNSMLCLKQKIVSANVKAGSVVKCF